MTPDERRRHADFWDMFQAAAEAGKASDEGAPQVNVRGLHDSQARLTRSWAEIEKDFPEGMAVDIARTVRLVAGLPPTATDELAALAAARWNSAGDAAFAAVVSDGRSRLERADGHQQWAVRTTRAANSARAAATELSHAAELVTCMMSRPLGQQSFLVAWIRQDMPEHRFAPLEWADDSAPRRALEALHVLLSAGIDDGGLATAAMLLPDFAGDIGSLATVTLGVLQR
jgi:hypothetical protein